MLDFWDCPPRSHAADDFRTSLTTFSCISEWSPQDFTLAHLHTQHHNGYMDVVELLFLYGCDHTLGVRQVWYPQQVPGSASGAEQPHCLLHLTYFSNTNTKWYRHSECVSEPVTAFKVDGRGCINIAPYNYCHFACPESQQYTSAGRRMLH